jgi:hypothetical protein
LTKNDLTIHCSLLAKILESLKQWEGFLFPIEIHARNKDEAHNEEIFQKIVDIIAKLGVSFLLSAPFSIVS